MKRSIVGVIVPAFLAMLMGFSSTAWANPEGIPAGWKKVYQFNLIGYPADKEYTGGCGGGGRIFVNRDAHHAHIVIRDHNDGWHVEDCNATTDNVGEIHSDELGVFKVFARILGKPNGNLHICAEILFDPDTHDHVCELDVFELHRDGGKSIFQPAPDSIFDASLFDIIWSVTTNEDFRIANFRVYRVQ